MSQLFQFYLTEYEKLKEEQHKRIQFRDNMIYLTLAAIGAVFSFALEKPQFDYAFLILPLICLVLGWTYSRNDEKIDQINSYIISISIPQINLLIEKPGSTITINWELYRANFKGRKFKKIVQFAIDSLLFCVSGITSVVTFLILHTEVSVGQVCFSMIENLSLIILFFQFYKGKENRS